MPFTLAHAAAALPFRRTPLIMSALVMGCFAPDFDHFPPFGEQARFGHTLPGVFALDLPIGLAMLWLFNRYAREPLAACLPNGARERLDPGPSVAAQIKSVSQFAMTVLSILVGIATHVTWDAFTHCEGWIVHRLPVLHTTVLIPLFGPRAWFDIMEYFSSAFGILLILLWYIHWYRTTSPVHHPQEPLARDRVALACLFLVSAVCAFVRAAAHGVPHGVGGSQRFMTDMAITGISVLWIEVLIYGVVRNILHKVNSDVRVARV